MTLALSGCTEMRIEGDAKVFQSSAVGSMIRTVIGIGLMGLAAVALAGSVLPDRKPKNRVAKPNEKLSSSHRAGLALFGAAMGFVGLFLACISFVFPSKLHVTVYPDRVAMASTYSQTGGNEVVVPFAGLSAVELSDERSVVGKRKTFLVFTQKNGSVIKQDAGNNERQAVATIQQAFADFQSHTPIVAEVTTTAEATTAPASAPPAKPESGLVRRSSSRPVPTPKPADDKAASSTQKYSLKRYKVTIPVPDGQAIVDADTDVKVGMKLGACYAGRWESVTVVAVNDDGTITCTWDKWSGFTYRMMREDLTIAEEDV
ncbi:hypothetical protein [Novipirellula sp.]|uniref:hypothetical protein n=1 Tax=Novipirellula sp. TaxID=2795430 RepID=UPI0035647C6D